MKSSHLCYEPSVATWAWCCAVVWCSVVSLMCGKEQSTRSSCALDYAYKAGLLFWSDVMDEKIYSARIGSGDQSRHPLGE